MMLRAVVKFLLLSEAFAVATYAVGWWAIPLVALVCGLVMNREGRPIYYSTICAAAGWLSLLLLDAARGPLGELAARFGGVMGFSPVALFVTTLIFPALLAWSASSLGVVIRARVFGVRQMTPANA
ncbi:MAG: hypothetical protein ABR582_04675 [Gemmatimonadaceae bacterium]